MTMLLDLMDATFGWLLDLPRDLAILLLAVGTSVGLTLVRKLVTDQEHLGRCSRDLARLKELIRTAKRAGDKDSVRRMQSTMATVRLMQLRAEGRVLVVAFVLLALLGWWGLERLEFYPLKTNDEIRFVVDYRPSAVGSLTHLVPVEGLGLESSAVQIVPERTGDESRVEWNLRAAGPVDAVLVVRCQGKSLSHAVKVGGHAPSPREQTYETGPFVRSVVPHRKFVSLLERVVPSGWLPEPAWVWSYLLATLCLFPLTRRLLRVA